MKSSYKVAILGALTLCLVVLFYYMKLEPPAGTGTIKPPPQQSHAAVPPAPVTPDAPEQPEPTMAEIADRIRQYADQADAAAGSIGTPEVDASGDLTDASTAYVAPTAPTAAPVTTTTATAPTTPTPAPTTLASVTVSTGVTRQTAPTTTTFVAPPPANSGGLEAERAALDAARPPAPAPAPAPVSRTYTIQAGDTFSSIARKLYNDDARWHDIAHANPLVDPSKLKIGQVIRLPDPNAAQPANAGATATSTGGTASTSEPRPAGGAVIHTVTAGETLSTIARTYYNSGARWDVIFRANRNQLSDPDQVREGMKLTIPPAPNPAR